MDTITTEYKMLTALERKVEETLSSSCLLSLNAMSLSVAVDACRMKIYFEGLLKQWEGCLPLGDACDVDFGLWGNKVWDMMQRMKYVYGQNHVLVNLYEYETAIFRDFKEKQSAVDAMSDSLMPLQGLCGKDVTEIVMCALRDLNGVLLAISEFLNSPDEEQIARSFEQWRNCYRRHYHGSCQKAYRKWKISFSKRTLRKNLQERMKVEMEGLKGLFENEKEWDMVYDAEQKMVDYDGLSRVLFTNAKRYGVSHIDERPMLSEALRGLFVRLDMQEMMQADLQIQKRTVEKPVAALEDDLEKKVLKVVEKVSHLAEEKWKEHLTGMWQRILHEFRNDIAKAGPHEKFKEFSKKTVYCIIGHLKMKGVYQQCITNVELTKALEGQNNGMRKYLNNGLSELSSTLEKSIKTFVEHELLALAA